MAIPGGAFVAVLGPNGAGKTTLFRAALGLVRPRSGRITVLGAPPRRGDPRIGYMPQSRGAAEHAHLRGRDLLLSAAGGAGWGLPQGGGRHAADVEAALAATGTAPLADAPLGRLSGGQRQRLLLAQALLGRPKLLLLDEPLVNLDLSAQHAIVALARRCARETGAAVLVSAHDLSPLLGHVDRVLCLADGRATIGTVDEVIHSDMLTRIYGAPVKVVRADGQVFVVPGSDARV